MNRLEFIQSLRKELRKLPPEEIVEATQFFEEYFDDALEHLDTAGMTEEEAERHREMKEAEMIGELGSPKAIAKQIKADYASRILESEPQYAGRKVPVGHKLSAVWWVIIGICSAPVSIPIAICIGCVAFGILAAIFSVMISIYSAIIGVAAAGLAAFVAGFVFLPAAASSGVMTIGAGLILMALSAAAGVGAYIGSRELIRALARLGRRINDRRKEKKMMKMRGGVGYETLQ